MEIKSAVRKFIVDTLMPDGVQLTDDTSFMERNILDSKSIAELTAFLQDTFAIEILDEEMVPENLDSLNAIKAFVEGKLAGVST